MKRSQRVAGHRFGAVTLAAALAVGGVSTVLEAAPASAISSQLTWRTVANLDNIPPGRPGYQFNSFNQPSVNDAGIVVFKARTKAVQGTPVRGIYTRSMQGSGPISTVSEVGDTVPAPNNTAATFNEFPSFPRIDATSSNIATRGQSTPVLSTTLSDGTTTKVGTSGVYVTTGGALETGVSLLGNVPGYGVYSVPGYPNSRFDQFPGAAAIYGNTVAFKGNYTLGASTGLTGVFYRDLGNPANSVQLIADSATVMPGQSTQTFGSTAPPSAAAGKVVFTGWDNEATPTVGGIYLADLTPSPVLTPLVSIGEQVPGQAAGTTFSNFGEGLSFDGRYVGFWASWGGNKAVGVTLSCPTDGNADLIAWCSTHDNGYVAPVPAHQGIFVYDTSASTNALSAVATDDSRFSGFQYWVYSGMPPGAGGDDASMELPHWRVSAFAAISGLSGNNGYQIAFKASTTDGATGIYVGQGPSQARIIAAVRTSDPGNQLDHDSLGAEGTVVTSVGLERDGFRNGNLVINASFLNPLTAAGWAGIYYTSVSNNLTTENQTISFPDVPPAYPGDSFEISALASSGLPVSLSVDATSGVDVCTVTDSTVHYLKAGTCVVAADSASDLSYNAGHDTLPITVVLRPQTITFPALSATYLGESQNLGATSDSGLPVTYSISTGSPWVPGVCSLDATDNSMVHFDALGDCEIVAVQNGNDAYAAATPKSQTVTVVLHPQSISFTAPPSVVYVGSTYTLHATADSGLAVSFSLGSSTGVCSLNTATTDTAVVKFLTLGTCVVNMDQSGSATYDKAVQRSVSFAVVPWPVVVAPPAPTPQVITVPPPPTVTVGGTYTIPATTDSGLPLTYTVDSSSSSGVCTLSGSTVSFSSVGTCVVNITQPGDTTHEAALAVQKITVGAMSTSMVLAPSTSNLRYGQTGRANAKVSFAVGTAAGTVQFSLDGRAIGSALPVVNGTALSPALRDVGNQPLRPGTHTVTAVFTPSDVVRYASATASAKYVVTKASTRLSVVVRPTLISATAATVAPGVATATGTVTFKLSGKVIGRAVLHNRVATLRYVVKAGQARLVTATYSGNAYLLASSSPRATFRA